MKLKPNQFYLPSGALITERPILYQTEMIQANLNDLKTQTRREIKNYPKGDQALDLGELYKHNPEYFYKISPYGRPSDLLWARETFGRPALDEDLTSVSFLYKADYIEPDWVKGALSSDHWKPYIHMPKAASRIWSMVEDVRVERLHDISKEDAIAEGVGRWVETRMKSQPTHYKVYTDEDPEALYTSDPIDSYRTLWISINGQESWDANPWLWVIKYRILSKTGRPSLEVIERAYSEIVNPKSEIVHA
jgi:hypothetical protein